MYGLRRSVVAAVDIPVGVLITRQMVTTKRPGHGIKPKHIDRIVGRRARVDIEADEVLTWDMV
jgi:sialic acid synthase SpsE